MAAVPIGLAIAGAASGYAGARKEKKAIQAAQRLAAEGRADYGRRNAENLAKLHAFAGNTYGVEPRAQRWADTAAATEAARNAELAAAPQGADMSTSGPQDAAQLAWIAKTKADEGQRLHDVVRLLSKAGAPQSAAFREGVDYGQFAGDYGSRLGDANNMLRAFGVDTQGRMDKAKSAGSAWNLLSNLFWTGAKMTAGGGLGGGAGTGFGLNSGVSHVPGVDI